MTRPVILVLLVLLSACGGSRPDAGPVREASAALPAAQTVETTRVRLANTEQFALSSTHVDQTFQIKVSLPRGYDREAGPYPVLYVTDAETNFGGVTYIVQRLIKDELIPEVVVVGVAYDTDYDSFYDLRSRDLTPIELPDLRIGGRVAPTGGADAFAAFLEQELFPVIEDRYGVRSDDRALYGHSYGGLFGSWILLTRPDMFRRYVLLSPSLWFDDERLLTEAASRALDLRPTVVYMGSGELEGRIDREMTTFANTLRSRSLANLSLKSEVMENETHRTVFGRGVTNGLRFIYGGR